MRRAIGIFVFLLLSLLFLWVGASVFYLEFGSNILEAKGLIASAERASRSRRLPSRGDYRFEIAGRAGEFVIEGEVLMGPSLKALRAARHVKVAYYDAPRFREARRTNFQCIAELHAVGAKRGKNGPPCPPEIVERIRYVYVAGIELDGVVYFRPWMRQLLMSVYALVVLLLWVGLALPLFDALWQFANRRIPKHVRPHVPAIRYLPGSTSLAGDRSQITSRVQEPRAAPRLPTAGEKLRALLDSAPSPQRKRDRKKLGPWRQQVVALLPVARYVEAAPRGQAPPAHHWVKRAGVRDHYSLRVSAADGAPAMTLQEAARRAVEMGSGIAIYAAHAELPDVRLTLGQMIGVAAENRLLLDEGPTPAKPAGVPQHVRAPEAQELPEPVRAAMQRFISYRYGANDVRVCVGEGTLWLHMGAYRFRNPEEQAMLEAELSWYIRPDMGIDASNRVAPELCEPLSTRAAASHGL